MKLKHIILLLFVLMVAVQLYVPASMIWSKEKVINQGVEYKFRAAPIDPNDPFRGKYMTINIAANTIENYDEMVWLEGDIAYAILGTDEEGFAIPLGLEPIQPFQGIDYIKVEVDYISGNTIIIKYPFDRYYMDEDKALLAESIYFESLRDTAKVTCAIVMVNEGKTVLQDVQINGESLVDLVEEQMNTTVEPLEFD